MVAEKQRWRIGDIFVIRNDDGRYTLAQIVGREPSVLNSVTIALVNQRFDSPDEAKDVAQIGPDDFFSALFVTRDLLDSGRWQVVGHGKPTLPSSQYPYQHLRKAGYVGAKVIGSGIVESFVNAFYGLAPWDDWKDADYLDRLLVSADRKPKDRLVYKRRGRGQPRR